MPPDRWTESQKLAMRKAMDSMASGTGKPFLFDTATNSIKPLDPNLVIGRWYYVNRKGTSVVETEQLVAINSDRLVMYSPDNFGAKELIAYPSNLICETSKPVSLSDVLWMIATLLFPIAIGALFFLGLATQYPSVLK